jgi:hypothetical protein
MMCKLNGMFLGLMVVYRIFRRFYALAWNIWNTYLPKKIYPRWVYFQFDHFLRSNFWSVK